MRHLSPARDRDTGRDSSSPAQPHGGQEALDDDVKGHDVRANEAMLGDEAVARRRADSLAPNDIQLSYEAPPPALARAQAGLRGSMGVLALFVLWLLVSVFGPVAHGTGAGNLVTGLALLVGYSFFTATTYLSLAWRVWTILRRATGRARTVLPWLVLLGIAGGFGIGLLSSRLPVALCFGSGIAFAVVSAIDAGFQLTSRNRLLARLAAARDSAKSLAERRIGGRISQPPKAASSTPPAR